MGQVILASQSPRRKELLKKIIPAFSVCPSRFDESTIKILDPTLFVRNLAFHKADTIVRGSDDLVIGCDTVVAVLGKILGKPKNREEEIRMLHTLSGQTHQVITGVCVLCGTKRRSFECTTQVTFYPLTKQEISAYADSDEPYDKAGGYGIQGQGGLFIKKIDGDYNNVVGLPVAELYHVLQSFEEISGNIL